MRPCHTTLAPPSGGVVSVLSVAELRQVTGALGDQSYSDLYFVELGDAAAAYVERVIGHLLRSMRVVDYYPCWTHEYSDRGSYKLAGRRSFRLSASSPAQPVLTAANYAGLSVQYEAAEDGALTELAADMWRLDLSAHYPRIQLSDDVHGIELFAMAENPVRVSYSYVARPWRTERRKRYRLWRRKSFASQPRAKHGTRRA